MKKKVLAVLTVILCLSILGGVTAAYFTDREVAHNVITSGNVDIKVVEMQEDGKPYPVTPIKGVMPATEVSKIVTVKNVGKGEAWIRVQLGKSLTLDPDAEHKLPEGQQPDLELVTLEISSTDWVKDGDWYYYTKSVAPGASTAELLKSVSFSPRMDNPYQGCTIHVLVNAQAVQTKNNPLPASGNFAEIPGWPADK